MGLAGHRPNSTLSKAQICPKNGVHLNLQEFLFHKWSVAFGAKVPEKGSEQGQPVERYLVRGDAFMRLVELSALHRAQVQTRWGVYGVIVGAIALVVQTLFEILK
jgi:hypothetical protein